jgi:hypothetical protein
MPATWLESSEARYSAALATSQGGFTAVTGRLKIDYRPAKLCKIIPGPASSAAPVPSYLFLNNNHDGMGQ